MHPHVLDVERAALLLKVGAVVIRRWAQSGEVPGTRIGGQWRFWAPALLTRALGPEIAKDAIPSLPADHVEPGIVDSRELAKLLGVTDRTMALLMRDRQVPGEKVGGTWRTYWPSIRSRLAEGKPLDDAAEVAHGSAGEKQDRP